MSDNGKNMWAYSHKNGWYQIPDFLFEYHDKHDTGSGLEDVEGCGYSEFSGFYYIPEPNGGNIVQVHRLKKYDESKPEFLVEVSFAASDVDFVAAKEFPDVIELLNKLAPLAHAACVAEDLTDKKL